MTDSSLTRRGFIAGLAATVGAFVFGGTDTLASAAKPVADGEGFTDSRYWVTKAGYRIDNAAPPNVVVFGVCDLPAGDYCDVAVLSGAHLVGSGGGRIRSMTIHERASVGFAKSPLTGQIETLDFSAHPGRVALTRLDMGGGKYGCKVLTAPKPIPRLPNGLPAHLLNPWRAGR